MLREPATNRREHRCIEHQGDFVIVGGGLAGVCAAITAAREGLKVVLINDRPVLGGNASSEVRLWVLGATSHMGNNNRWAREGGVVDEILVENNFRNSEGNPLILDSILLEKVAENPNITLLLNTSVYDVTKSSPNHIDSVTAFCSQNGTRYVVKAPLFCDSSGDGVVGFLAGAAFRMGAETPEEFGELFAPDEEYGALLGHSLYFYTKDVGRPVSFVPPSFALKDVAKIPRYRSFSANEHGCQLWWIEYGGRLDTIHDSEEIKWELWRIVYGVWDHIKNSGEFPDAETMTLEWVGHIPGKRESRRFEGDYMLTQQDIVEQRQHDDAVSYGGWSIDLHPADGVYSALPPCNQWHPKGVYQIPYRCMYSRNIDNLFLAGRVISVSHVAFGSSRVMGTCATNAQAVGMAASICTQRQLTPRQLVARETMQELQGRLLASGQYIPHVVHHNPIDLAQQATVTASSQFELHRFPESAHSVALTRPHALLLPLQKGKAPKLKFLAKSAEATELEFQLRLCSRAGSFTPDTIVSTCKQQVPASSSSTVNTPHSQLAARQRAYALRQGRAEGPLPKVVDDVSAELQVVGVQVDFDYELSSDGYAFVCVMENPHVSLVQSEQLVTGILTVARGRDSRVGDGYLQKPPPGIGIDEFEMWCPPRRPVNRTMAFELSSPVGGFEPHNVINGVDRPFTGPNAWVASLDDDAPRLTLRWPEAKTIGRIQLALDTDHDNAMESVLMRHPEQIMPQCVRSFRVLDDENREIYRCDDNHQTLHTISLAKPVVTRTLHVEVDAPSEHVPAALFGIRCFEPTTD